MMSFGGKKWRGNLTDDDLFGKCHFDEQCVGKMREGEEKSCTASIGAIPAYKISLSPRRTVALALSK